MDDNDTIINVGNSKFRPLISSSLLPLHDEFCVSKKYNSEIDLKMKNYNKMIRDVKNDSVRNKLYEEMPFYPEINLINEYVITRDNEDFFDMKLLDMPYETENEKIVLDYIKKKLDKRRMNT